jgi:uncharacterized membrane protein
MINLAGVLDFIGIGFVSGLRTFTAPAIIAWAARSGLLHLEQSPLAFMGSTAAVVILSLLAAGEYVGDLLPKTPKRTSPGPLIARIISGGLSGACLCAGHHDSVLAGIVAGAIGAVIGAFTGYEIRRRLVAALKVKDVMIAIPEDLIAISLAYLFVFVL